LGEWKSKYDELQGEYETLKDEREKMECNFASEICGRAGMIYYFVKRGEEIVCCLKSDPDYCIERPTDETIKEITC
jgi:hypothetical protein